MTDQPRRRLRAASAVRPVGAPNVLTNQATPNVLSTMRPPSSGNATTGQMPADPRIERSSVRPRRLPSLGTVLFVAALVYMIVRFLTQ